MTSSVQLLLCLSVLLTLYVSHHSASGSKLINCRKFVYHPKCRGVAAKRAARPAVLAPAPALALAAARDSDSDRKQAFHPLCRGVQVKRVVRGAAGTVPVPLPVDATRPVHFQHYRKQEEEVVPDAEYLPVTLDLGNDVVPRRPWTYLPLPLPASDRNLPGLFLARRKPDATPDALETAYDYE